MNKVILCGRLTRDPEVRYSQAAEPMAIARYSLAVDRRRGSRNSNGDEQTADFINCVAFGRAGEFAEKYLKKGTKMLVTGRIQTGSYTNKEGVKVYTTEVVVEEQEFAESKNAASSNGSYNGGNGGGFTAPTQTDNLPFAESAPAAAGDGFMNIPEGLDEELPFN